MTIPSSQLLGRFRGALLGAAVADALALPYQHYSRVFLRSLSGPLTAAYAEHHSGFYPQGQYSDDTQLMLAIVDSLVEAEGASGPTMASHLVPLWRDSLLVERDESSAEAMQRLRKGIADWGQSGLEPGHAEATPLGRVVGLALWRGPDLEGLCDDVRMSTLLTHQDPRVMACAAAAAAAVANTLHAGEFILGPFLDSMARAASRFHEGIGKEILDFPRVLSITEYRALRHFETIFPDSRYPTSEEGLVNYCVPALWTAVYYFLRSPHGYERAVAGCIAAGGHVDTPAMLAGAMSGALLGLRGIPKGLVDGLVNASDVRTRADRLFETCMQSRHHGGGDDDASEPVEEDS